MYVCMYVCACLRTRVCPFYTPVYVYARYFSDVLLLILKVGVHASAHAFERARRYMYTCVCLSICMPVYMYTCRMFVYLYVCMIDACMRTCVKASVLTYVRTRMLSGKHEPTYIQIHIGDQNSISLHVHPTISIPTINIQGGVCLTSKTNW